jgi:hypothetical protein
MSSKVNICSRICAAISASSTSILSSTALSPPPRLLSSEAAALIHDAGSLRIAVRPRSLTFLRMTSSTRWTTSTGVRSSVATRCTRSARASSSRCCSTSPPFLRSMCARNTAAICGCSSASSWARSSAPIDSKTTNGRLARMSLLARRVTSALRSSPKARDSTLFIMPPTSPSATPPWRMRLTAEA